MQMAREMALADLVKHPFGAQTTRDDCAMCAHRPRTAERSPPSPRSPHAGRVAVSSSRDI